MKLITVTFHMFVGHFCPPGSGYGCMDPIETGSNPDRVILIQDKKTLPKA
jgi:hypothetical protein